MICGNHCGACFSSCFRICWPFSSRGAGYYSCIPIAKRYNKLLEQARGLFGPGDGLMSTFEEAPLEDSKDPADKMKVIQGISD